MNLTRDRLHSIGWAFVLSICAALTAGLTLRVNAVKSEVHQAESRIVHLRKEIAFLETEFQTRSNQQQLKALNDVEFGYDAPRAAQYIEGERHLAALGKPAGPGAPAPIRFAYAAPGEPETPFMAMVSPIAGLTGGSVANAAEASSTDEAMSAPAGAKPERPARGQDPVKAAINAAMLGERLARIETAGLERE